MREAESANGPAQELQVRRGGRELSLQVKAGKLGLGTQHRGISVSKHAARKQQDDQVTIGRH
jgi:hypothetical protein